MLKKISDCRNDFLSVIYGKLSELKSCEKLIKQYLPERLAKNCQVTDASNGIITLTTSNAAILTQLQHYKSDLLQKLRIEEKMYALKTINFKLQAPHLRGIKKEILIKNTIKLSSKSWESIHATAENCDYSPLKKALEKLEKTLKENAES